MGHEGRHSTTAPNDSSNDDLTAGPSVSAQSSSARIGTEERLSVCAKVKQPLDSGNTRNHVQIERRERRDAHNSRALPTGVPYRQPL